MDIEQMMKSFKLTRPQVYKALDSLGIPVISSIEESRGFNDGRVVNGVKKFDHIVFFGDDKIEKWSDVERVHDYACGFLGFDPCKQN